MPIHSLELINVGPFRPRPDGSGSAGIKLEFDANVNLLIGPNNVGKSTILQVLAAVAVQYVEVKQALPPAFKKSAGDFREDFGRAGSEVELVWTNAIGDYRDLWNVLEDFIPGEPSGLIDFGLASLRIGGPEGLIDTQDFDWSELVREFGYVDYYNPASPRTPPAYVTTGSNLPRKADGDYDDPNVYEAINLKRRGTEFQQSVFGEIDKVILEITEGFRVGIGVGVFANDPESGYTQWRKGQNKFETMDGELTFPELSHGTRSVFAWLSQFMLGMAGHYENDRGWKRRRGIFIIDEIDAHLHPSWQRRIIPTLQRHFPNVQIFASTHSPMMVAGLKAGQVHLLKRNEKTGAVEWSPNPQNIIGWTADEIYRTFMGIDDPTDERTAQHAEELRELRAMGSLSVAEEERLRELEKLVNEDLAAGGWQKAQDERFDEILRRVLSTSLSESPQDEE